MIGASQRDQTKGLFDELALIFHHSCDAGDASTAADLLNLLDQLATRLTRHSDDGGRVVRNKLAAASERLCYLRIGASR